MADSRIQNITGYVIRLFADDGDITSVEGREIKVVNTKFIQQLPEGIILLQADVNDPNTIVPMPPIVITPDGNFKWVEGVLYTKRYDGTWLKGADFSTATVPQIHHKSESKLINVTNYWNSHIPVVLDSAPVLVRVDLSLGMNFDLVLRNNVSLANPLNAIPGIKGYIYIRQDGTGNRTILYGSGWRFVGASPPTMPTAGNSLLVLEYVTLLDGGIAVTAITDPRRSTASNSYTLPVNTDLPTISNSLAFGDTALGNRGSWSGNPTPIYTYQWQRGIDTFTDIPGATSLNHIIAFQDVDQFLRLVVTAHNTEGSISAFATSSAPVQDIPADAEFITWTNDNGYEDYMSMTDDTNQEQMLYWNT